MNISDKNVALANELRAIVHKRTQLVSDGEGIAMILLWSFLADHARIHTCDIADLARDQLEAFIAYADTHLKIVQQH